MNQKILDVVMEFEEIHSKLSREISLLQVVNEGEDLTKTYVAYYRDSRKELIEILKKFFLEESRNDFVTLFGVYCNFYLKRDFHQFLPEEDFGVSELWNVIIDDEFQKYLSLIQQGIDKQQEEFFEDALQIFGEYSLPHLYLFVFAAQKYDLAVDDSTSEDKKQFLKSIQDHYNKMDLVLREYSLGIGKFVLKNFALACNKNFLPYVKTVDTYSELALCANGFAKLYYFESCERLFPKFMNDFLQVLAGKQHFRSEDLIIKIPPLVFSAPLYVLDKLLNEYFHNDDIKFSRPAPITWRNCSMPFYVDAFRDLYLKIPLKISNAGSFLLDQMEKLRLKSQRDELIADFTHTCKNLNATNLGRIAESLLKMESEQEKNWGRALLLEFARKDTLNKKVTMLNMRYEGDSKKLVETLEESLADESNGIRIAEVLQMTALYCFVEFFYDEDGSDAKRMRKRTRNLWKDRDAKKISFENEVIFNQKNCIDWMMENGFYLQINIDGRWQKIFLQRNDYAEVFFRDIFLEMIKNFLKYGEVAEPVEINLHSDESTLKISMRNLIAPKFTKDFKKSTNRGLIAMNNTLEILYIGKGLNVPKKSVRYSQDDNFFVIELLMPAEIFLKGDR